MANRPRLAAASRTVTGKKVARMRHDGLLPAVVYGHGTSSENVSVIAHDFELLRRHVGASTLVDLSVDGGKARPVLVHAIQVSPITRKPLHVDLFAVQMTEELTVEVQLVGDGEAPAIELGGTLMHPVTAVKVRALPDNLPESLHYDLSPLVDFETTVTVADIEVPEGVTIQAEPTDVVARVLAPRVEEVTEVEAAPEGEAPEGEAAEGGDASAEAGGSSES
jgi:large subunit ribosomal protein L25